MVSLPPKAVAYKMVASRKTFHEPATTIALYFRKYSITIQNNLKKKVCNKNLNPWKNTYIQPIIHQIKDFSDCQP